MLELMLPPHCKHHHSKLPREVGCVAAALWIAACVILSPVAACASVLLAPAVGAADSATQGTRVADPLTPSAALFENPAGLTGFDTTTHGGGLGIAYGRAQIEAAAPIPYNETDSMWAGVPDFGVSIPYRDNWRLAVGVYGSTGSKFDFNGNAAAGVPSFFSETIVIAFPLGVAYRLTDQVSIGAEVQPLFGQLRTRFPLGGLDFHYKINGPGVQGMVGTTVRPTDEWAFGVSVRTPGMIWMGGSMPVSDADRQRVHSDLEMPAQVFLGATWRTLPRLTLSGAVRYTNSRTLGNSTIEYEQTPQANSGFLPYSKDEWRFALAAEHAVLEGTMLRLGTSWASHIVGTKGVSPLAFDTDDTLISIGVGQAFDHWVLDLMAGYGPPSKRHIPPDQALVLPGAYSAQGMIFMFGVTYH